MIDISVVLVTAVILILASLTLDVMMTLITHKSLSSLITVTFLLLFAYFLIDILAISLSIFFGILLAKILLSVNSDMLVTPVKQT